MQNTNYANLTPAGLEEFLKTSGNPDDMNKVIEVFITSETLKTILKVNTIGVMEILNGDSPNTLLGSLFAWADASYSAGYKQGFADGGSTRQ